MHIKSGSIENFKGVDHKVIEVDGRSFVVSGPNAAGKSSEIQALLGVLSGKGLPEKILPKDAEPGTIARVEVVIEGKEGESYHVIATYAENPKTEKIEGNISIKDHNGKKVGITAFRTLIGDVSFDIFNGFLSKRKADQIDFLKDLSGVRVELDKLDMKRKEISDNRLVSKKQLIAVQEELKGREIDEELKPVPTEPILDDIKAIEKKVETYNSVQQKLATKKEERRRNEEERERNNNAIKSHRAEIEALMERIKALELKNGQIDVATKELDAEIKKGEDWFEGRERPSLEALQVKLTEANEVNRKFEQQESLKKKFADAIKLQKAIEKQNKEIADIDSQKVEVLGGSKLPVPGLTFDEEGLYLDGVPFSDLNTAKHWEVGFRLMVAMNNNLRVCRLDMNSMDKNTFAKIVKMAEEHDIQCIFELVNWESEDGEKTEIKFVEEFLDKGKK
jgi:DNA repair exonuclease SbcCD ATPase subunit